MKKIKEVLIVDDDPTSTFLIATAIEEMGIADKVAKVYNGQQAIDYLAVHSTNLLTKEQEQSTYPFLILLDLNMPVMNGFEFLEEFNNHFQSLLDKISICILTSSAAQKDIMRAQNYKLAGYITKPLTEDNLLPILSQL